MNSPANQAHALQPAMAILRRALCLLLGLTLVYGAQVWAQSAVRDVSTAPAPVAATQSLAKDLQEEILHMTVTVADLHGRRESRSIPVTVYRPAGAGPHPLVVYSHGRSVAAKRAQQGRSRPEAMARYLVDKGFVVLAPTRVGYAETYGDFDPESSGSCSRPNIEAMSLAASDQVLAAVELARTLPYVDATRWLAVGQSVGGLTSVATVGRAPAGLLGGINFSGGTGGNPEKMPGAPCTPSAISQYWAALARTARAPMLWLYWENDKYWGSENPRLWHKAWVDGGAQAAMHTFGPSGEDGHNGSTADMDHWLPVVDRFLGALGFATPAIVRKPPASGYAVLDDLAKVPVGASGKDGYAAFLRAERPRAFAVSSKGGWGSAWGDYAVGRALGNCRRFGQICKLYAVDDDIVWNGL